VAATVVVVTAGDRAGDRVGDGRESVVVAVVAEYECGSGEMNGWTILVGETTPGEAAEEPVGACSCALPVLLLLVTLAILVVESVAGKVYCEAEDDNVVEERELGSLDCF
jgi:hypothetical protein